MPARRKLLEEHFIYRDLYRWSVTRMSLLGQLCGMSPTTNHGSIKLGGRRRVASNRRYVILGCIVLGFIWFFYNQGSSGVKYFAYEGNSKMGLSFRVHRKEEVPPLTEGDVEQMVVPHQPIEAFVTFLCDDEMLQSTRVLVRSIQKTETTRDIVVMVLEEVSAESRSQLERLGAIIRPIDRIQYPYEKLQTFKLGINKQCRYSKLHIFGLVDYSKIVYLDSDMMVTENVDMLFDYPAFSAVRDVAGAFNTGLMVIEPSTSTFKEMMESYLDAPSYNRGDQGFINWFFDYTTKVNIPDKYNAPAKLHDFALGKLLLKNAAIYHFTSETKPWSFFREHQKAWKQNIHYRMFGLWMDMHYEVERFLGIGVWTNTAADNHSTGMTKRTWKNVDRVKNTCRNYPAQFESNGKFQLQDMFSVSISTYSPERIAHLQRLVTYYLASPLVDKVFIVWHNPDLPVGQTLVAMAKNYPRIVIQRMKTDTLNNRFSPLKGLRTQAVFICDDDILMPNEDLEFGFEVWKRRKDGITGYFPRIHQYGDTPGMASTYDMAGVRREYSIILTKAMFINADYLYAYTCLLPHEIHAYVDEHLNCEDIAMNMLVTGMSGEAPTLVEADKIQDYGWQKGISIKNPKTHTIARSQCIGDLITRHWNRSDPLRISHEIIRRYRYNRYRKAEWDEFDATADRFQHQEGVKASGKTSARRRKS